MSPQEIASLLDREMGVTVDTKLSAELARYLELLVRWNARTNLTAVRDEGEIVLRHFGESLQCARSLPLATGTLLDYGSGAGFPGLVCSLVHPSIEVLLAESQGKKASFLQHACRFIPAGAKVHPGRVEDLALSRSFDIVTMRAVDRMEVAIGEAVKRVRSGGWLAVMTTREGLEREPFSAMEWSRTIPLMGTEQSVIALQQVFHK